MSACAVVSVLRAQNPDAYLFVGMDCALVGVGRAAHKETIAVYSQKKMVEKLVRDGFTPEDAEEYLLTFVNIWAGDSTPVILQDILE